MDHLSRRAGRAAPRGMSLSDTTGNFLAAMHVTGGAPQVYGGAAKYTITQNGATGLAQYSNTNTVNNALPGVSLTLASAGTSATITVAQDTTTAVTNINTFVTQFNSLDWITPDFQVTNLRRGVFRSVVKHRDGNQHWQSICQTTSKDPVKAWLLYQFVFVYFAMDARSPCLRKVHPRSFNSGIIPSSALAQAWGRPSPFRSPPRLVVRLA